MTAFLSTLSLRRATMVLRAVSNSLVIFLSTLSLRRATLRVVDGSKSSIISIHALLAESDLFLLCLLVAGSLFLSTLSLRRATEQSASYNEYMAEFLSTLSLRRATAVGL